MENASLEKIVHEGRGQAQPGEDSNMQQAPKTCKLK